MIENDELDFDDEPDEVTIDFLDPVNIRSVQALVGRHGPEFRLLVEQQMSADKDRLIEGLRAELARLDREYQRVRQMPFYNTNVPALLQVIESLGGDSAAAEAEALAEHRRLQGEGGQ